ncbi:TIGR03757 family integrating conjugative element protein [Xenorhabdus griffiniae]|uniref:TIGR03757 family integrating conjugative element protein n=1 Tax=Xenorhabdus griffiniae TaxID=351672 RepID=A0ABY9XF60_9GAMM|nr:TIGR03757 family integrating conjugative element protein [Xenorhabdus griffiniae]MBD1228884.1 TIGR03757 family integrating conjugative element protein [Xenorhabdus griffiniae]MBE8588556.1 TIGR03757 family integrating conjugative element protein [Xenorhabdus griffiniae]WMV71524.1 TIGR03757 family integrating conjugative element protein [Xenorhabdus griffiniae]WNH01201.1 TIGR03757 family integrating conjugative element protein [Xenorhabdus griffiniae]
MRKRYTLLFWLGWMLASASQAKTVIYTDSQHPPVNLSPDTHIVWLDAVEQHQRQIFAHLSADPQQALIQAQAILQSPHWHQQEQPLIQSYRAVVEAWQSGVRKYPAVVFDDRDVVYGTADVAKASALREQSQR